MTVEAGERPGLRETQERLRKQVYDGTQGNPQAVRDAERHIKAAIQELERRGKK